MNHWKIITYNSSHKEEWNRFVKDSRNGTFLFYREYMDYHADRFTDFSMMFYKKDTLCMLFPANVYGNTIYSHQGLTYGGFLMDSTVSSSDVLKAFEELCVFLKEKTDICRMIYSPIPYIYTKYPSEEDLYALYRMNAILIGRKIASVIPMQTSLPFSKLRKRKVKLAIKNNVQVRINEDLSKFWTILEENLQNKYNTKPVHSLKEMEYLQNKFPNNIRLYEVCENDGKDVLGGCILYMTSSVAHVQYISSTERGREIGALDFLFYTIIDAMRSEIVFFDMGTSVESNGSILNEGLIFQKEGFGGRAVMYDTYELNIR